MVTPWEPELHHVPSAIELDKCRLLKEVALYPAIWDTRLRYRSRCLYMADNWLKIAGSLGVPLDECKRRWQGLRGTYRSEIRRVGCLGNSTWRYFPHMEFMRDVFACSGRAFYENHPEVEMVSGEDYCVLTFDMPERLFVLAEDWDSDMEEEMEKVMQMDGDPLQILMSVIWEEIEQDVLDVLN
ncbi:hypothetical protein KR009_004620 [Drosophila setifemur]|nr:hypothetical protein KR009_004620 [Drosophila setifemur]